MKLCLHQLSLMAYSINGYSQYLICYILIPEIKNHLNFFKVFLMGRPLSLTKSHIHKIPFFCDCTEVYLEKLLSTHFYVLNHT